MYSITQISSEPTYKLRLGLYKKEELDELYHQTPTGSTFLWEVVASCLMCYSNVGLRDVNVVILTDGDDNCSSGCWNGIKGAVQLIRLARELKISLTISFVQLGGEEKEVANLRTIADITGGVYLHVNANLVDLDQINSVLENIATFGHTIETELTGRETRDKFIQRRRSEGFVRIRNHNNNNGALIDTIILESIEYSAMFWCARILRLDGNDDDETRLEKLIREALLKVFTQESSRSDKIHANKLRNSVHDILPVEISNKLSAKQISHIYNTKFLNGGQVRAWLKRGVGADCGVWYFNESTREFLRLCNEALSNSTSSLPNLLELSEQP